MGISSFYRWLWTIGSPASINTTPPLQVCQSLEKMRCQERNPWGSLRETFGKSIQIFTCQQNLKRRNTHVKNTHTHQPCLHNPHHCGHSVFRNVKHVLQQGGKCSSFEMCLFPTKAEREREGEWGSGKKKKKEKAGPGNPADSQASKSLPPSPIPHLVSMSLEFKPKWKEIVSCWHQGSSVAYFPCLRFRRNNPTLPRSAIYKQYTWSYSPANQSHNSLVVSTSMRSRLHSLTLAN